MFLPPEGRETAMFLPLQGGGQKGDGDSFHDQITD
jgi:hypothetical protein